MVTQNFRINAKSTRNFHKKTPKFELYTRIRKTTNQNTVFGI